MSGFSLKQLPLRQIPALDAIRFISIFLVVLHHQFFEQNIFLSWFKSHGWLGVDIFFVMSGFLITSLLQKELSVKGTINLKSFWFRRILRLWPSWIFTLFVSIGFVYVISENNAIVRQNLSERWWHYFLHFGNYSMALIGKIHILFSHLWSLAVEEHFYLFWPLLMVFIRNKKWLIWTVIILIVVPFLFRLSHIQNGLLPSSINIMTHTRIDEILFGCLLSFIFPYLNSLKASSEIILTVVMLGLYYFALYFCKSNHSVPILYALTFTLCGIASCLLIIIALKGSDYGIRRLLRIPILAKLGVLSYGVYLVHLQANSLVFSVLSKYPVIRDQNLIASINLVIPFIPAYFMYFYLDEYFAKFKKH